MYWLLLLIFILGYVCIAFEHTIKIDKAASAIITGVYSLNVAIGLLSAIVDNVPLVAGAMGMYSMETYPPDSAFWEGLAYCAGTGGSALIIGSAAGVAIMGILVGC